MKKFHCDICGADRPVKQVGTGRSGMVQCSRCGLFYRLRRPVGKELEKLYGNEWYFTGRYQAGNEKVTTDYLRDKPNIMVFVKRRFKTISKYKKTGRVLDIGAAMGFYLEYFKLHGWKVAGVEYNPFAAKYAIEKLGIKDMFIGDVNKARYQPRSFDAVLLMLILEHFAEPVKTLRLINRWMKPGGILSIKTPHAGGLTGLLDPVQWWKQHPDDHNVDFTIATMSRMLAKAGFEVLEYETEGIYVDRIYRALRLPVPKNKKVLSELNRVYMPLAQKLFLGDSLVMFARKV